MFRQNKIHFTSLGCARNLVDTEVMLGLVLQSGFEITPYTELADFLVVNTCGFLEASRNEALVAISDLIAEKKPEAKIIVAGCMVQKHARLLKEEFPQIHYFLGSGDTDKILEAIRCQEQGEAISDARSYLNLGEIPRVLSTPSHYAYLKIAEGCKKRCSFCIIPNIKGRLKSKPISQIVREFHALLNRGVREIILIAQDLGDYGKDLKIENGLAALLQELLKTKKDFWLRLLYLYPDEITEDLIDLMEKDKRICRYVDMPIQHINDQILKSMHRKTNRKQIIDIITNLRKRMPDIVIRTSLMVGFPGETDEQFEELVRFIKDHPLDQIGIFKYSKEAESYSASLPGHLPEEIKQKRLDILAETQQEILEKILQKYLGRCMPVILEGYHPKSPYLMRGRFFGQAPEVDGEIIINDGRKVDEFGTLYEVKITDVIGYDLIGKVLKKAASQKQKTPASPLTIIS